MTAERHRRFPAAYLPLALIGRPLMRLLFSLRREGEPRLPDGGVIVAANHVSFLDIPALAAALDAPLRFMATAKYAPNPFYRALVGLTGSFFVPISGRSPEAFRRALDHLARGEAVAVYPEGGISPDGALRPGRPGMARIALEAGVPIVPCAILGTRRAWPPGRFLPRPAPVTVRVGAPIDPAEWRGGSPDRSAVDELTGRVMAAIAALLADPPPPTGCAAGGGPVSSGA